MSWRSAAYLLVDGTNVRAVTQCVRPHPKRLANGSPEKSSASLRLDVASSDLAFVGGEGRQDFGLLGLRNLVEIESPSKLCCDLIKFCRGDPEVPMGLF